MARIGFNRTNADVTIDAEILSGEVLTSLQKGFLPEGFTRDISEYKSGDKFKIPTLGEAIVRDIDPTETDLPVDNMSTGSVELTITKFKGAGNAVEDSWREDSESAADAMVAQIGASQLLGLRKTWETDFLEAMYDVQTVNDANAFDGLAHKRAAQGGNGQITLEDINLMKFSLDESGASEEGRVLIVPGIVEMTLNNLMGSDAVIYNTPMFEGIIETGMAKSMRFIRNIAGFDIYVNSRLPRVDEASELGNATTGTIVQPCFGFVAGSDTEKPVMSAWRRQPKVSGERQEAKEREVFWTTARYGFGTQRKETLATTMVSAADYK